MWPDSSPAWRKRQPNTKPRLGINRNPPIDPSTSSSTLASKATDPVFPIVDPLIFVERQVEDQEGLAGEDEAAPAVTYNNGLWTPPASISIATPTPPGFTATILLAPTSASEDLETSKNLPTSSLLSSRPSATLTSQHTSSHYSSSELSSTSSSTSSTSIPSALPKKNRTRKQWRVQANLPHPDLCFCRLAPDILHWRSYLGSNSPCVSS